MPEALVEDVGDEVEGMEEEKGAGAGGTKKNVPYVNADMAGFTKNFVGYYDTGVVDTTPPLPERLDLDFGASEVPGQFGVRCVMVLHS